MVGPSRAVHRSCGACIEGCTGRVESCFWIYQLANDHSLSKLFLSNLSKKGSFLVDSGSCSIAAAPLWGAVLQSGLISCDDSRPSGKCRIFSLDHQPGGHLTGTGREVSPLVSNIKNESPDCILPKKECANLGWWKKGKTFYSSWSVAHWKSFKILISGWYYWIVMRYDEIWWNRMTYEDYLAWCWLPPCANYAKLHQRYSAKQLTKGIGRFFKSKTEGTLGVFWWELMDLLEPLAQVWQQILGLLQWLFLYHCFLLFYLFNTS